MEVTINTTVTYENLLNSTNRVSQHIGGTRSGKTYAILQYLIVEALQTNQTITIVRKTIPSLKRTVMKDFSDILKSLDIWNDNDFNIKIYGIFKSTFPLHISTCKPNIILRFR